VVAVVLGVAEVVALTSAASIVPSAVPKARWPQASARITAMEYLFNAFVGAPIGGLLVSVGFIWAFGAAGGMYAAGMILLSLLAGQFAPKRDPEQPVARRSAAAEIRAGLGVLWRQRVLRTMAVLIAVMAGSWSAWLALLPAYAPAPGPLMLTARQYGLLLTCMGAGGVIGTIVVGPVNRLIGRRWSMFADIVGSFFLVAAPAVLPAGHPAAFVIAAAAFVPGIGGTMWTVNSRVLIQTFVPDGMLGRFNAAYRMISWGSTPVAAALGGILAQFVNYHVAFGFFAVSCLLIIVPYLRTVTHSALAEAERSS
jgi:predicted MFS family arabinose efflux permease